MSSIDDAHPQTFTWIWSRPEIGFQSWLESLRGLYWIQGTPGSGKSTLMKSLAQGSELQLRFRRVLKASSTAIAFFAFHVKMSDISGSIAGMLRSILWQLLQAVPWAGEPVVELYRKIKTSQPSVSWAVPDLRSALLSFLQDARTTATCILIDGLDEYHGKDEHIAQFLDNFATSVPPNVRLCLASRPYPDFAFQFHNTEGLKLHENTAHDISVYIRNRFAETAIFGNADYNQLAHEAITKAQGSFLWSKLACNELQQNWRRYQALEKLRSCLRGLPPELNTLYLQIFEQLEAFEADDLARMLTILVNSSSRLSLPEFCHIFDLTRSYSKGSPRSLLPIQLEDRIRTFAEQVTLPVRCRCRINQSMNSSFENSGALSETPDVDAEQPRTNEGDGDDENLAKDGDSAMEAEKKLCKIPQIWVAAEDYDFYFGTGTQEDRDEDLDPVQACPHSFAHPWHADLLTEDQWRNQTSERINMVGRGFIQADTSSVTLSHETVATFWARGIVDVWQQPKAIGQEMLLQACISYLNLLADHEVLPSNTEPGELERFYSHYPFLFYSSSNLLFHCQESERVAVCSQVQNLRRVTSKTLLFWKMVCQSRYHASRVNLGLNREQVLDLLEFALEFRMDLTAIDLTSQSAQTMLLPSDMHPLESTRYNDIASGGSLLFLAAGNDNPHLVSALVNFGVKFDARLPYTSTAPHRAVFDGNLRYLQAFLDACSSDTALHDAKNPHHFTAAPELFVFNSRRWYRELVDNKLASSLLQFCVVVDNEQAFRMALSKADNLPRIVGSREDALVTATYYERLWAVRALLSAGANPDYVSEYDCPGASGQRHVCCPLAATVFHGNKEMCLTLLRAGAHPTKKRYTRCHPPVDAAVWVEMAETPLLSAMLEYVYRPTSEIVHIICWMLQCGGEIPRNARSHPIQEKCGEWLLEAERKHYKPRTHFHPKILDTFFSEEVDDVLLAQALANEHHWTPADVLYGFEPDLARNVHDWFVKTELMAATLPPRPPSRMGY